MNRDQAGEQRATLRELSWRVIEEPILSLKRYFPSGRAAAAPGGAEESR